MTKRLCHCVACYSTNTPYTWAVQKRDSFSKVSDTKL